jgi:hypothetical protein
MVATREEAQSSSSKIPRFPVDRLEWLSTEVGFESEAATKKCMHHLDGTYQPMPLFPVVLAPRLAFQLDPLQPDGFARDVDHLKIPLFEADGVTQQVNGPAMVIRTCVEDYMARPGELVKLNEIKRKHDEDEMNKKSQAWSMMLTSSENHLRDLVLQYQGPPIDPSGAYAAVKAYYEGATDEDKRMQLDLLMESVTKILVGVETPTLSQVQMIISAIDRVTQTFGALRPAGLVPDHRKKSIFTRSLPTSCNGALATIQSLNPAMTYRELSNAWTSSMQTMEVKESLNEDRYTSHTLYSAEKVNDKVSGSERKLKREDWIKTTKCWYCDKIGHTKKDCRKRIADSKNNANSAKAEKGGKKSKGTREKSENTNENEEIGEEDNANAAVAVAKADGNGSKQDVAIRAAPVEPSASELHERRVIFI